MERVIYDELYEYCSSNNLLTSKHSGFKKHDSTVNRLLDLTTKIYHSLGDGSDVLMFFLDVTKAFDKVYHRGLIIKWNHWVSRILFSDGLKAICRVGYREYC